MKKTILIILTIILVGGCSNVTCDNNIDHWIDEAPKAFNEFKIVKNEILSNPQFVIDFSIKGNLFLSKRDTGIYSNHNLSYLIKWFQNDRGLISFKPNATIIQYKQCINDHYISTATIFYNKISQDYVNGVKIIDSLDLGNNWHVHITSCYDCDK